MTKQEKIAAIREARQDAMDAYIDSPEFNIPGTICFSEHDISQFIAECNRQLKALGE